MARHLRVEYPGALYHVMARGNDRRPIFQTVEDRRHLLELLGEGCERYEVHLYAYIWMTTHYHLAVQTEHANLHEFMHFLNTAYTVWTNRRNRRTGHLFEGRYKAIAMENAGYLLSATGYVHLNPVPVRGWKSRPVAERLRAVAGCVWSSYGAYTGGRTEKGAPAVECDRVWAELGAKTEREGRKRYRDYIRGWLEKEEEERRKPSRKRDRSVMNPFVDVRLGCFVGSDGFRDFVQGLLGSDRELDQGLVGYRHWRKQVPMMELLSCIAEVRGVSVEELRTRRRGHVERDLAALLCREVGQKGLAEIGAALGVTYSAVSVACRRTKEKAKSDRKFAKQYVAGREALIHKIKP